MRYEDFVRRICGENWRDMCKEERDGGYGVACMVAFQNGTRPSVPDMASHLGVSIPEIDAAFTRLARNGIFGSQFNAKKDKALGKNIKDVEVLRAWAHIAGVAGSLTGV